MMTGELERFLRHVGPYRHQHDFVRYDGGHDAYVCQCGAVQQLWDVFADRRATLGDTVTVPIRKRSDGHA